MVKKDEDGKREIAKKTETALATATANFFEKYGQAAANRSHVGDLLKFTRYGEFRFGKYDEEAPLGTVLAACTPHVDHVLRPHRAGYERRDCSANVFEGRRRLVAIGGEQPANDELDYVVGGAAYGDCDRGVE